MIAISRPATPTAPGRPDRSGGDGRGGPQYVDAGSYPLCVQVPADWWRLHPVTAGPLGPGGGGGRAPPPRAGSRRSVPA
ncbi:hypothetical protein I6A84_00280 [Frankia sp. CNm7]|nr:hypothetical protein [Frankia nepalensis]